MAQSPICGVCGIRGHRNNAHQFDADIKRCTRCKESKPLSEFYITNRRGAIKPNSHCKICDSKIGRDFYNASLRNRMQQLAYNARRNNLRRGKICDFDIEYLMHLFKSQRGLCGYTGKPMTFVSGNDCVSIDQKIARGGYTKSNIILCRLHVNMCKRDHNFDSFLEMCRSVTETHSIPADIFCLSEAA